MRAPSLTFAALLGACVHSAPPATVAGVPAPSQPPQGASAGSASPTLAAPARTFGALLQQLGARADEESGRADCLFDAAPAGVGFAGRFAPAVHPLPANATPLAERLKGAGPVDVLTRYGRYEKRVALPLFATITEGTPSAQTALVAQTTQGILLRPVAGGTLRATAGSDAARVVATLAAEHIDSVFVTADPDVALDGLTALLRALDEAHVASTLVASLPESAALHPQATNGPAFDGACPNGLPEERGELGELSASSLRAGVQPLTQDLLACLASGDIAALRGGRLRLALRVDARGRVARSCIVHSDLQDPAVLSCVLARANALRFDAPSPAGSVDAELPLAMQPAFAPTPRALCNP